MKLALPGFVDGHCHLDKTLWGMPWRPHVAGASVADRIEVERKVRGSLPVPTIERGRALLEQMLACGTTALRTHVDIDTVCKLDNLNAILELREQNRDRVDMQIVAFPQSGILRDPGVAELLDAALKAGADLVGGLDPIGIDSDLKGHLDVVFALASRHGKCVDIHLHDGGESGLAQIEDIAARTVAHGLGGKVAISHAFALGDANPDALKRVAADLAKADVSIMTHAPGAASMPPVRALREAGVEVFSGSDNIRDLWSPYGNGDMLERARLIGYRQNFRKDEEMLIALDLVTEAGRRATGLGGGDTVVEVEAGTIAEAIATCPPRLAVRRGTSRVVT
jgi:cytosine deaminase